MKDLYNLSRREFVKRLSILAGSSVMLTSFPWISSISEELSIGNSINNKVRLGIVGFGDRGEWLFITLKPFLESLNTEIVAICDDYEPHLQKGLKQTGASKGFNDYRKMLDSEKLDGIILATPPHHHADITVDALGAGVNVFCEKVMARTMDDTKRMYDAQKSSRYFLQIGFQRLFRPVCLEGIEKIHKGELGKIVHMHGYWHRLDSWRRDLKTDDPFLQKKLNWRMYEETCGGLMVEFASHQLQIANWVMQSPPKSVIGTGTLNYWKDGRETFDNESCIFVYEDGTPFIYDCILSSKHYGFEEKIIGTKGNIEFEINKQYSATPPTPPAILQLINDLERKVARRIPIGKVSWVPENAVHDSGDFISENYHLDEIYLELEAFISYIRGGNFPEKLIREAYYATQWSLLAEKAIRQSDKIEMPEEYKI